MVRKIPNLGVSVSSKIGPGKYTQTLFSPSLSPTAITQLKQPLGRGPANNNARKNVRGPKKKGKK